MKAIVGGLFIFVGILIGLFGGFGLLAYGTYEIFTTFETMTFGDFVWAVFLMMGRDILAWLIAAFFIFIGLFLLDKIEYKFGFRPC